MRASYAFVLQKNNAEVSTYSVLTPTFIIEPFNLDTTAKYGPYKMYGPYRFGDPVGIRTLDLLIRSQSLYPAELPSHDEEYSSPELLPLRFWQGQKESNPQPTVLETATLPVELYPYEREERT